MSDHRPLTRAPARAIPTILALGILLAPTGDAMLPAVVVPQETAKLQPAGPNAAMHGWSIESDGATLVVGAPGDSTKELGGGSALVYQRTDDDWTEQQRLFPDDPQRTAFFGSTVAVSSDVAVVAAPFAFHAGVRTGAAYVFEMANDEWSQTAKLVPAHGRPSTGFGQSVAVDGDTAMIGAGGHSPGGALHEFQRDATGAWVERSLLKASDADANPRFGSSVALDGDRLVAGGPGARADNVILAGALYVFERQANGSWLEVARLTADDATPVAGLGQRVDLDGDAAIAGAPLARNPDGFTTGAGYTFERDADGSWKQTAKMLPEGLPLVPEDVVIDDTGAEPADSVGWDVAIHDGIAVLGSPRADDGGPSSLGADVGYAYAYVATPGGWVEQARLMAWDAFEEGDNGDEFGFSVEVAGGQVLVGARNDETVSETLVGSVYVFETVGGSVLPPLTPVPLD